MEVHSYFELATTLVGWHIANGISEMLVISGLIFIPFGIAVVRNWTEPTRSQEARNAAPVSLRRMEQDIGLGAIVVIFFFLPAVPIDSSQIQFNNQHLDQTVSAGDPDVPYMRHSRSVREIRVPVLWWSVYKISSLFTHAVIQIIDQLHEPATLRPTLMRIARMTIDNEHLINEMRQFRRDCYDPSLAKYQNSDNHPVASHFLEDVDWLGSYIFLNTPGYYRKCEQINVCGTGYHASNTRNQWHAVANSSIFSPGKPYCDSWWSHSTLGLRSKLLRELESENPSLRNDIERIRNRYVRNNSPNSSLNPTQYEDRILRRLISQAPWIMVDRADRGDHISRISSNIFSIDGIQQVFGSLGALAASALFHIVMELIVIGLPMVQALMLMMLYISIPLITPYAVVNPSIIIRLTLILFSLQFVSALWAIAEFLDEKLLETMYPDAGILEFGGSGTTADLVLSLITLFSYISLPALWFMITASVSSFTLRSIASGWAQFSQHSDSAILSGTNSVTSFIRGSRN